MFLVPSARWNEGSFYGVGVMVGILVAFTGLAGAGKSTASDVLVDNGWVRVKMAGPLKDMAKSFMVSCGVDAGDISDYLEGQNKETCSVLFNGVSPRHIMQTLGSEWGRSCIDNNLWVDIARRNCIKLMSEGYDVVIDDVRFENECAMVRKIGGDVGGIVSRGGINGGHVSENYVEPDYIIKDDHTELTFKRRIEYVLLSEHT